METFNFPYHLVSTTYPESTGRVQLGRGWVFPIAPQAPDQRIFTLEFSGMKYFVDVNGVVSETINADRNVLALERFYQTHLLYKEFNFVHAIHGATVCRFNAPLDVPKGLPGADGMVASFDVKLIEVPR